jgi:hypothetical protein
MSILKNNTSPVFSYTGEVTTKVLKNNKVLRRNTVKNKGLPNLFSALCSALTGQSQSNVMPARIVLYTYNGTSVDRASESTIGSNSILSPDEIIEGYWSEIDLDTALTPLTSPMLYTTPPEVYLGKGNNPETRFIFKIPYSVIKDAKNIKLAVLYPNKSSKTLTLNDALAFRVLDSEEVAPPEGKENAHLLVEWTMNFANISQGG